METETVLTQAEAETIFANISKEAGEQPDYALLYTLFYTCLRSSAALSLKWGGITHANDCHILTWQRDGKQHTMRLGTDVYEALVAGWQAARSATPQSDDYLFRRGAENRPLTHSQANRILKKYARRAGIAEGKASLHNLRHAGARLRYTLAQQSGTLDLHEFQHFLGHATRPTTQVYIMARRETPADPGGDAVAEFIREVRQKQNDRVQ